MILPFFFLFSCYKFSLVFVIIMNLVTKNMQIREVAMVVRLLRLNKKV
jgi:hypothetical protein